MSDRIAREVTIGTCATGLTYTGSAMDGAPVCQPRAICNSAAATARWAYLRFDGQTAFAQKDSSPVHRHDGQPLQVAIASIRLRGRCLWWQPAHMWRGRPGPGGLPDRVRVRGNEVGGT